MYYFATWKRPRTEPHTYLKHHHNDFLKKLLNVPHLVRVLCREQLLSMERVISFSFSNVSNIFTTGNALWTATCGSGGHLTVCCPLQGLPCPPPGVNSRPRLSSAPTALVPRSPEPQAAVPPPVGSPSAPSFHPRAVLRVCSGRQE